MITLEDANKAIEKSIKKAEELGIAVTTTVVDEHGVVIATSRMDGSLVISPKFAHAKAYTSATLGMPTAGIAEYAAEGKKVMVFGASTKGNTILQYYGINNDLIQFASERSPEKWGKHTVGTLIKCISEEEARNQQPDYFLVLPFAFFKEMYNRETEWLSKGGKFIVPLPEFRVVP